MHAVAPLTISSVGGSRAQLRCCGMGFESARFGETVMQVRTLGIRGWACSQLQIAVKVRTVGVYVVVVVVVWCGFVLLCDVVYGVVRERSDVL